MQVAVGARQERDTHEDEDGHEDQGDSDQETLVPAAAAPQDAPSRRMTRAASKSVTGCR